jgi:hypothetical protein
VDLYYRDRGDRSRQIVTFSVCAVLLGERECGSCDEGRAKDNETQDSHAE